MANRRLANSIKKKLTELDAKIDRELDNWYEINDKIDRWEKQKVKLLREARKKGLKLVRVGVADGSAIYWEIKRSSRLVTFEWLYGGGDYYVDDWGPTVAIPLQHANRMIKAFRPDS